MGLTWSDAALRPGSYPGFHARYPSGSTCQSKPGGCLATRLLSGASTRRTAPLGSDGKRRAAQPIWTYLARLTHIAARHLSRWFCPPRT